MLSRPSTALAILGCSLVVHGHFMVTDVIVDEINYQGYFNPNYTDPYEPTNAFWLPHRPFPMQNQIFFPMDYTYSDAERAAQTQNPDIICGINSTAGQTYVPVRAGSAITFQWMPVGHQGPVMTYLANCHGPCTTVDKKTLEFFKIDEAGHAPPANKGVWDMESWGAGIVQKWNNQWTSVIPRDIVPGNYVVRHEIIGIQNPSTPQFYPSCFNLKVYGRGWKRPEGVLGTELYQSADVPVIGKLESKTPFAYSIPGPTVWRGATTATQTFVTATATSTGIV